MRVAARVPSCGSPITAGVWRDNMVAIGSKREDYFSPRICQLWIPVEEEDKRILGVASFEQEDLKATRGDVGQVDVALSDAIWQRKWWKIRHCMEASKPSSIKIYLVDFGKDKEEIVVLC